MKIATPVDLIIINKKNQILLCKRAEKEQGYQNTWSIPGGGPKSKENFEETLRREILEELNCKIKNYKYFKSYYVYINKEISVRAIYFYGEILGKIKLNKELSEYKWFNLDDPELEKLNYAFNQKIVIKEFIKFLKKSQLF